MSRYLGPITRRYKRVTFEKQFIRLPSKAEIPMATLLHPGHPLMQAVTDAERAMGYETKDVSIEKCGWEITSMPPMKNGRISDPRHIEVKGRAKGQTTITVTKNEIITALNQSEKFLLAIVLVDGDQCEGPYYVKKPFNQEPDWAVTSINLDLIELLKKAESVKNGGTD